MVDLDMKLLVNVALFFVLIIPGRAASIVVNTELDLGDSTYVNGTLNMEQSLTNGSVTIHEGDTVTLNILFADNMRVSMGVGTTDSITTFFLLGLTGNPNSTLRSHRTSNGTLEFLGLAGDPVNNPSTTTNSSTGAPASAVSHAHLFKDVAMTLGDSISFHGLSATFLVHESPGGASIFSHARLRIPDYPAIGPPFMIPEPSRALLIIIGLSAIGMRRRRK